jgi:DNA recombination protein RmuC
MNGMTVLAGILLVVGGFVFGWCVRYFQSREGDRAESEKLRQERAAAEIRLEEANKKLEEQKQLSELAKEKMSDTFKALSGDSLEKNNRAFLDLAQESLKGILEKAKGEIGQKEQSIEHLVKPLQEALVRYETQIKDLEIKRAAAYTGMDTQVRSLVESQQLLQRETGNLVSALRRPEVRGRWGEITLKRVAELAGMVDRCDYTEQVSVDTPEGRVRPDMIVHLPAGREIVVDSKVSLDAYLDALSAETEDIRKECLARHAQQVRKHMKALSNKAYWNQFEQAPEFVVMFIPGESFLSVAVEEDVTLIEDGMEKGVIIATPTTLNALLRAIAYGWRQEQVEKNSREIAKLGRELYNRFQPFLEHANKTGSSLAQAVDSFNNMMSSLNSRVMVSVKKFQELGVAGEKEIPEALQVDRIPMAVKEPKKRKRK